MVCFCCTDMSQVTGEAVSLATLVHAKRVGLESAIERLCSEHRALFDRLILGTDALGLGVDGDFESPHLPERL